MLTENARPFTRAPKESPIGSPPRPPSPDDSPPLRVAMCPQDSTAKSEQTPALLYSLRPLNQHDHRLLSIVFLIPDPVQLRPASSQSRNLFQISSVTSSREAPYGIAGCSGGP